MGIRRQNSVGTGYWLQCTWLGESRLGQTTCQATLVLLRGLWRVIEEFNVEKKKVVFNLRVN